MRWEEITQASRRSTCIRHGTAAVLLPLSDEIFLYMQFDRGTFLPDLSTGVTREAGFNCCHLTGLSSDRVRFL